MKNNKDLEILFAGESWMTHSLHTKGFSTFETGSYAEGLDPLRKALIEAGANFTYFRNHEVASNFPFTLEELDPYDVIILSDIPADTFLLSEDTFVKGERTPNRLQNICDFVRNGGGLLMVGGYMSFSGFQGKANYHFSPLAEVLPVKMFGYDDRIEAPQGVIPQVEQADHPILSGIPATWPHFLGYNKLMPANHGEPLMTCQNDPFLIVNEVDNGRTAAFASDCSPHWAPAEFVSWAYYPQFWNQLVNWLAKR